MNSLVSLVRSAGVLGASLTILDRTFRAASPLIIQVRHRLAGAEALEVGGPSQKFMPGGLLPVYDVLSSIDNVTFATETIWEGVLGETYEPIEDVRGRQLIADGTNVGDIGPYDAILSCHVIEHIANPMQALAEWHRILRAAGLLVLVAPHGGYTFDRRRPVTSFEHLIHDYERGTQEDDRTHVEEVLAWHDISRDPGLGGRAELRERIENNAKLRSMHHHVFDERLLKNVLEYSGFRIEHLTFKRPFDIVAVGTRV